MLSPICQIFPTAQMEIYIVNQANFTTEIKQVFIYGKNIIN